MSRPKQHCAMIVALILTGALSGCTAYRTCGFGGCPQDARITAEVQRLLHQHPALNPPNLLHVRTYGRVVYLYGQVDTEFERRMAESVALEATDVARVVNSISVSNGSK